MKERDEQLRQEVENDPNYQDSLMGFFQFEAELQGKTVEQLLEGGDNE